MIVHGAQCLPWSGRRGRSTAKYATTKNNCGSLLGLPICVAGDERRRVSGTPGLWRARAGGNKEPHRQDGVQGMAVPHDWVRYLVSPQDVRWKQCMSTYLRYRRCVRVHSTPEPRTTWLLLCRRFAFLTHRHHSLRWRWCDNDRYCDFAFHAQNWPACADYVLYWRGCLNQGFGQNAMRMANAIAIIQTMFLELSRSPSSSSFR